MIDQSESSVETKNKSLAPLEVFAALDHLATEQDATEWIERELVLVGEYESDVAKSLRTHVMQCDEWRVRGFRKGRHRYHLQITAILRGEDGSLNMVTVEYAPKVEDAGDDIPMLTAELKFGDDCPKEVADMIKQHCEATAILEHFTADSIQLRRSYTLDSSDDFDVVMREGWQQGANWGTTEYAERESLVNEGFEYSTFSMKEDHPNDSIAKDVLLSVRRSAARTKAERDTRWMEFRDTKNRYDSMAEGAERQALLQTMEEILNGQHWRVLCDLYDKLEDKYYDEFAWDDDAIEAFRRVLDIGRKPDSFTTMAEIATGLPDAALGVYLQKVAILRQMDQAIKQLDGSSAAPLAWHS